MLRSAQDETIIRSIADLLAALDQSERGSSNQLVRFYARSIRTPDGKQTGLVSAISECQVTGEHRRLDMPTCSGFVATLPDGTSLPTFAIDRLHGAIGFPNGSMYLQTDGQPQIVKNVRFRLAPIDYTFSELERLIVDYALQYIGKTNPEVQLCYRQVFPGVTPSVIVLDFGRIATISIPSVKGVVGFVETQLEQLLKSPLVMPEMLDELEHWQKGSTASASIRRTLKRSGLIFPQS